MEDRDLVPGDELNLQMALYNPEATSYTADAYILLEVADDYWCWPGWENINSGLSHQTYTVPAQTVVNEGIIYAPWGSGMGSMDSLAFIGALFEESTWNLIGEVQIIPWRFHE